MALVKYGAGVIQMAGSIAGTTFARNRAGSYARAKTKPVNPNTSSQTVVRAAIALLAQTWRTVLTSAQRTAWDSYAAAIVMNNKLGESQYITGFNHYIRSNAARLQAGQAAIANGPTELALPEQDPTLALIATVDDQKLSIAFDVTQDWASEDGGFLLVYMGKPQNATRNFFAGPWKYAGKVVGDAEQLPTSPQLITAPMTIILGQRIFIYCRVLRADGRLSTEFYANAVAVAT